MLCLTCSKCFPFIAIEINQLWKIYCIPNLWLKIPTTKEKLNFDVRNHVIIFNSSIDNQTWKTKDQRIWGTTHSNREANDIQCIKSEYKKARQT
jgi:hypothetical protein